MPVAVAQKVAYPEIDVPPLGHTRVIFHLHLLVHRSSQSFPITCQPTLPLSPTMAGSASPKKKAATPASQEKKKPAAAAAAATGQGNIRNFVCCVGHWALKSKPQDNRG